MKKKLNAISLSNNALSEREMIRTQGRGGNPPGRGIFYCNGRNETMLRANYRAWEAADRLDPVYAEC